MLDSAPDSERSLPSGIGSEFNDLQSANSSLGAKAALDKFEINLNEIQELNRLGGGPGTKQPDSKKQIEQMLSQPQNLTGTLKEAREAALKD